MKRLLVRTDKLLLFVTTFMFLFGLLMIFSSSSVDAAVEGNAYSVFIKQAISLVICLIATIFIIKVPINKYHKFVNSYIFIVFGALIFLYAYGHAVKGVKAWIDIGFFSIQPSEFAKSAIILFFGSYYLKYKDSIKMPEIYKPLIVAAGIAFLTYIQPDLGTMLIILSITFLIFIAVPIKKEFKKTMISSVAILGVMGIIMILTLGKQVLTDAQMRRFDYFKPCSNYYESVGYQVCNGFIAINNGGLLGRGLGNSTQKYLYLPESYTDFIFPVIVEELGLVTGISIILGYILIIHRIIKIAARSHNLMGAVIAYGTAIYILSHITINLVGVLALLPLTGVPLPFLSYGGSYALNLSIMLALVQRVEIENKLYHEKKALREGEI